MSDTLNGSSNSGSRRRHEAPASRLRELRLSKNLSQAELAARAGLSPGWISLLERTPEFMTSRAAQALAAALSVRPEEILP
jgi:transcriptional regulator with XRE-family HTH domain